MNKGNITITLTNQADGLKVQGTCENLNREDVLWMLGELSYEIAHTDIMDGLNRNNGGYFEEIIKTI